MIIFLYGADTYRSRQKLKEIKDKFRREVDPQGLNLSVLSGAQAKVGQLMDALSASPFLARKRMVVLEQLSEMDPTDDQKDALIDMFGRLLESDTVFVLWEEELGKRDLSGKLFKAVMKSKLVYEFASWDSRQVAGWMMQQLKTAGVTLEDRAWAYVSLGVGDNMWLAASETEKLIHFAQGSGKMSLSLDDTKDLVAAGLQDDVFALVDAVSKRQGREALWRLYQQLDSGSHELELLSMIIRQFRIWQQVADGLASGMTPDMIAKIYKMHPFVVKKMSAQVSGSSLPVHQVYRLLADTDAQIKSTGIAADVLLSRAVAKLAI
jgi:DNA polymerase III subunit delta